MTQTAVFYLDFVPNFYLEKSGGEVRKINETLARFEISSGFRDWAINYLNELNDNEETSQTTIKTNLLTQLNDCDKQLRSLLRLRISPANVEYHAERQKFYSEEETRLLKEKKSIKKGN